jgi:hypothetical protein
VLAAKSRRPRWHGKSTLAGRQLTGGFSPREMKEQVLHAIKIGCGCERGPLLEVLVASGYDPHSLDETCSRIGRRQ